MRSTGCGHGLTRPTTEVTAANPSSTIVSIRAAGDVRSSRVRVTRVCRQGGVDGADHAETVVAAVNR